MFILRLFGLLALIAIVASLLLYAFTRERRYIRLAGRIFVFNLVFVLLLAAFFVAERLLMVV